MPKSRRFFSAQNKREWLLPAIFIAHALLERNRKRFWHLSLEGEQRRLVARGRDEPGECRNREDSSARKINASGCCPRSSSRWLSRCCFPFRSTRSSIRS